MYFEDLDIAQLSNASKHEVLYAHDGAMRKRYHHILSTGEGGSIFWVKHYRSDWQRLFKH